MVMRRQPTTVTARVEVSAPYPQHGWRHAGEQALSGKKTAIVGLGLKRSGLSGDLDDILLANPAQNEKAFETTKSLAELKSPPKAEDTLDTQFNLYESSSACASSSSAEGMSSGDVTPRIPDSPLRSFTSSKSQALVTAALQCAALGFSSERGGLGPANSSYRSHEHLFFALCDGTNGDQAADFCRRRLAQYILGSRASRKSIVGLELSRSHSDLAASSPSFHGDDTFAVHVLTDGIAQAEADLVRSRCASSASVLAILLQAGGQAINLAWVGNCSAVLCRSGKPIVLTMSVNHLETCHSSGRNETDTSKGGMAPSLIGELGGIDAITGEKLSGTSGIPQIHSEPIDAGDEFVLLGTKGLFEAVPHEDAVRIARAHFAVYDEAQMVAEKLAEIAIQRRKKSLGGDTGGDVAVHAMRLFAPRCAELHGQDRIARRSIDAGRPGFLDIRTTSNFVRVVGGF